MGEYLPQGETQDRVDDAVREVQYQPRVGEAQILDEFLSLLGKECSVLWIVELKHQVKVGFRVWTTTTTGTVVRKDRRRHSLHFQRNFDDKVYSDAIVLRLDDGELTTVTLDEFSSLRQLGRPAAR